MMSFDKDRNLLIVSGAVTGTLGVYEVHGLPTCPSTQDNEATTLTILHVNDHHSHIEGDDMEMSIEDVGTVKFDYGGFPRLVSLINEIKSSETSVLTLHAGDAISGTLWYSLFAETGAQPDAEMMGQACFDAFALGNHEFDDGDATLAKFLQNIAGTGCGTKVLAANVKPGPTSPLATGNLLKPYHVFTIGAARVGVVGIDIKHKVSVNICCCYIVIKRSTNRVARNSDGTKQQPIAWHDAAGGDPHRATVHR